MERSASTSAVLVCQGRAVADGRYAVGRFSDPVARELLDPAEAAVVDRVRVGEFPTKGPPRIRHEMVRGIGLIMVPRTVAIDDAIRDHAATQLVILGAGLDARGYRMPQLADVVVFEVDHPGSQRDKRRRVGDRAPIARRLVYVAVDLADQRLDHALGAAGFDPEASTTWVWEGVIPYLTRSAVRETVRQIADLTAPGGHLVVNYQAKSVTASAGRTFFRALLRVTGQPDPFRSEPWRSRWRPEEMATMLADDGFEVAADHDLLTLTEGLELPPYARRSTPSPRVSSFRRTRDARCARATSPSRCVPVRRVSAG